MSQTPSFTSIGSKELGACQEKHTESARSTKQLGNIIQSSNPTEKKSIDHANSPVKALAPLITSKPFALGILLQKLHTLSLVRVLQSEP
jgi:hypothetical protein